MSSFRKHSFKSGVSGRFRHKKAPHKRSPELVDKLVFIVPIAGTGTVSPLHRIAIYRNFRQFCKRYYPL